MNLNEQFEDFMRKELNAIQSMDDGNDRDARLRNFAAYWKEYKKAMVSDAKVDLDKLKEKYQESKWETEKQFRERELQLNEDRFEYQKQRDVEENQFRERDLQLNENRFEYQKQKDAADAQFVSEKLKKDTLTSRFGSFAQITMGLCTLGAALINLAGVRDTNATRLKQTEIVSNVENSGDIISGQKTKFLEK